MSMSVSFVPTSAYDPLHVQYMRSYDTPFAVSMQRVPHSLSLHPTGRFPVASATGSLYVVVTEFDGYIHAEAMAARTHISYHHAYLKMSSTFSHSKKSEVVGVVFKRANVAGVSACGHSFCVDVPVEFRN